MRIRNAAIAGATALAVAFSGASVATAAETSSDQNTSSTSSDQNTSSNANGSSAPEENDGAKDASFSSKINTDLKLEGDQEADGQAIFGSSKDLESQPKWAKVLYGTTIATAIATLIGMVVGPLANFVQFGPFSR